MEGVQNMFLPLLLPLFLFVAQDLSPALAEEVLCQPTSFTC
jgi:hypothetical protein